MSLDSRFRSYKYTIGRGFGEFATKHRHVRTGPSRFPKAAGLCALAANLLSTLIYRRPRVTASDETTSTACFLYTSLNLLRRLSKQHFPSYSPCSQQHLATTTPYPKIIAISLASRYTIFYPRLASDCYSRYILEQIHVNRPRSTSQPPTTCSILQIRDTVYTPWPSDSSPELSRSSMQ